MLENKAFEQFSFKCHFCGALTGIEIINSTDVAATFPPKAASVSFLGNTAAATSRRRLQSAAGLIGLFVVGQLLLL